MINNHNKSIIMQLDKLHLKYENFIIIGDLNSQICEDTMRELCCVYNLKNLVKDPTCYKNPGNPSSIDLILTNKLRSFQNTCVIETGLSNFHNLTVTVLKTTFTKQALSHFYYRNYKYFNNEHFKNYLLKNLSRVLRVTNLNGLPHSLLSYGHLIPGERACSGRTCMIKKFFQGPSKGRYIPWAVPEDSGYWLSGVLRGWSANG